jgi:hypothetical protein
MSDSAVFGIYATAGDVERAVEAMKSSGFTMAEISALCADGSGMKDCVPDKNTKALEGAATGAASGAIIGGTLGWLVGIGTLAIPGAGPFLATGPIMVALAGVGAGGTTGGLAGALIGLGIPEHGAKQYEDRIQSGAILLSIHSDDPERIAKAERILENTGAHHIEHADFASSDKPLPRKTAA